MDSSVEILIGLAGLAGLGCFVSFSLGPLCSMIFGKCESGKIEYGYERDDGPCTWKDTFPAANGRLQSPINIFTCDSREASVCLVPCLTFSPEFHVEPVRVRAFNDGHTVLLSFVHCPGVVPRISGGPLNGTFKFLSACFRWGQNDEEGSEHTINCRKYALELQATFIKVDTNYPCLASAVEDGSIVIICYFFHAGPKDNPYLASLAKGLPKIKCPNTCVDIDPIPLSCLMPTFNCQYVCYCGSLTYPPCTEVVKWIIQPEPLCISYKQSSRFRKLCGLHAHLASNTRPVQNVNNREIVIFK